MKNQRTVIIIDDSPEDRAAFRRYLERDDEFEYQFVECDLGEVGVETVKRLKPDCILVDYKLPDLDGLDILSELLDADEQTAFPVVMLTGTGDERVAVQAMKRGAQDYLVKGKLTPDDLRRTVNNAVDKWNLQRTLDEQRREIAEKNTELQRALESLRVLELGVNQASESIIITTAELELPGPQIIFVNDAFVRLTGYTAQEAIGNTPRMLQGPKTERRVLDDLWEKMAHGEIFHGEATNYKKDGSEFIIEWSVAPVRAENGAITHFVAAQHDITARKQAERERAALLQSEQAARQTAEKANRLKDEFLATVSHELRTPLTSMLGWSNLLRTGHLDGATAHHALEIIERNARAQNQLISDLLDVSRIITGKLRLDVKVVDLQDVIGAAIDSARPAAAAKSVALRILFDPRAKMIGGDPDRLQQVVWNLISNAIKFTDAGGEVQITLEQYDGAVEIRVADTGKGIAPEFLPFVFERFRQADGTTTRAHGGLGLGLAIVRQLVEMHGGTVSVTSRGIGFGATFTVRLPLSEMSTQQFDEQPDHIQEGVREAKSDSVAHLDGLRILVVDDDLDTREMLTVILNNSGATVTTADSASAALKQVKQHGFDLLISDIGMPKTDGYSLIEKLRSLPPDQGRDIPAIALTAYARIEDKARALRSGFHRHISKPIEQRTLIDAITSIVEGLPQEQP